VLVGEGERNRRVELRREPEAVAAPPAPAVNVPPPAAPRRSPTAAYVLGGLGVIALGGFAALAISGKSAESEMDDCKPYCSQAAADKMRLRYLLADISLGVGVVALGTSGVLYFSASREPASSALGGGSIGLRGAF
jgi:hypothetical protein